MFSLFFCLPYEKFINERVILIKLLFSSLLYLEKKNLWKYCIFFNTALVSIHLSDLVHNIITSRSTFATSSVARIIYLYRYIYCVDLRSRHTEVGRCIMMQCPCQSDISDTQITKTNKTKNPKSCPELYIELLFNIRNIEDISSMIRNHLIQRSMN